MLIDHRDVLRWLEAESQRLTANGAAGDDLPGLARAKTIIIHEVQDIETEERITERRYEAWCETMAVGDEG